ncbi:hypothetical protein [Sciscionella sediminilitoris]|uniref:hypothetical protein n=1 Tax=Sciscionella sediminilitoris TaxID=1445613 RepID=UPI00056AC58F|nr:hypothetical protein [Sciscionella sp. SE31]
MSLKIVGAWLVLNVVVLVLYTVIPPLLFNDGAGRILGMPEMLFWFTLLPITIPGLMAMLYLVDRRLMRAVRRGGAR